MSRSKPRCASCRASRSNAPTRTERGCGSERLLKSFSVMNFPAFLIACVLVPTVATAQEADAPPPPKLQETVTAAIRAYQEKNMSETLARLDEADAMRPGDPNLLNLRGAVLVEQKEFDKAAELFRKILAEHPKYYPARFNLAEIPFVQKNFPEAREKFQALLAENPKDELVQFKIFMTYLLEKNEAEAKRKLEAIKWPGDTPASYYGNAAWHYSKQNETEAVSYIRSANEIFSPQLNRIFLESLEEQGWITRDVPTTSPLAPATPTPTPEAGL